jgi:hypothetical protein
MFLLDFICFIFHRAILNYMILKFWDSKLLVCRNVFCIDLVFFDLNKLTY